MKDGECGQHFLADVFAAIAQGGGKKDGQRLPFPQFLGFGERADDARASVHVSGIHEPILQGVDSSGGHQDHGGLLGRCLIDLRVHDHVSEDLFEPPRLFLGGVRGSLRCPRERCLVWQVELGGRHGQQGRLHRGFLIVLLLHGPEEFHELR